ncbi:MAG: hypothetical protein K8F25_07635 [Fimbriimonadaceae bacterium]|nr:hypothetical protein [Alphaproteobacteria bacterium]
MEVVYFTLVAVILYFAADRILDWFERSAGKRFEYRSVYFFGILVSLAVVAFWLIQGITGG